MKKTLLPFLILTFLLSVLMPVTARSEEKASGKDAHLLKDLQSGLGGLVVKFNYYELNKGVALDVLERQGGSSEQVLQTLAKKKKFGIRKGPTLGILTPQDPDKEKLFKGKYWSDIQTFTGEPGNYRLTQAVLHEGRGNLLLRYISRIFQSVPIQKGKLLYLGEVNVVRQKKKDPIFIYTLTGSGLEAVKKKYPQSSQYLISRDLGLAAKTAER